MSCHLFRPLIWVFVLALFLVKASSTTAEDRSPSEFGDAAPRVLNICDPATPHVLTVSPDRSILLHCGEFDVRAVESSSESIVKAKVTTGNLRYFQITGVTEGEADLVIWPVAPDGEPRLVSVRVVPDDRKYQPLADTINAALGVTVSITPIPTSGKIRITGKMRDYWQVQRVLSYVISDKVPRDSILNEMTWACSCYCCRRCGR